ncbi:MAG: hypothetical protein PUB05_06500 [Firmicutes bacterium]|nr:hypothetical protein [Bacillota bacterium]
MRDGRRYTYYIVLSIIFAAVYLLQSGIGLLPRIFAVSPLPLLPLVTVIAMFESKAAAFAYGLFAGLLMDILSRRFFCFNTLFFAVAAVAVALLIELMFNNAPRTAAVLGGVVCAAYYFIYWLAFLLPSTGDAAAFLVRFSLVGAVYSWLFTWPFYFLLRWMSQREHRRAI